MVGGIAWQHLYGIKPTAGLAADELALSAPGADGGFTSGGMGTRKEMKEAPLEKGRALPRESFAGAVTLVQDSQACSELRATRDKVQAQMRQSHSSAQAKEFQLDLKSIRNRGTELGCWSGGAG